jgi:threonine synthase
VTYLGLRCQECGAASATETSAVCEACWGPLEPAYDLEAVRASLAREPLVSRAQDIWRYRELLPVARPTPDYAPGVGATPLLPVPRLAARLGIEGPLLVKNDGACQPTLSFKDRLVAVAVAKAIAFGMDTVGCSSTGNLAVALAARAAAAGRRALVIVPETVESGKMAAAALYRPIIVGVRGDYDRANRLASQVADRYGWGFVNINLRPFYTEGGKTAGFEIAEQAAADPVGHVVAPLAGGGLLVKLAQAFREAEAVGIGAAGKPALHGVQAAGCAPIVTAWRDGRDAVAPVRPQTQVHSLAVGDPADGPRAIRAIRESGGRGDAPTDEEAMDGVRLLAETEGLSVEAAGGLVVAAAGRLAHAGAFADGRPVVLVITGHGVKTMEQLSPLPLPATLDGSLGAFESWWSAAPADR